MYSLGESLDSTTEGERTRDLPKENDFCIMDRYDFYFFFNFDFMENIFNVIFYLMACHVVSRAILIARAPSSGDVVAHSIVKVP